MSAPEETYQLANPSSEKPYVSYGLAFEQAAARHAENRFNASRIYVVVSATISKTKDWTALQNALGHGKIIGVRHGIKPHTPCDEVLELAADLKRTQADLVITLGGGSLIDGVKLARLFTANDILTEEARKAILDKIEGGFNSKDNPQVAPATIPCIFIPTSLSGGEWTKFSGATDADGHKIVHVHTSMLADLVIYDPALTVPLPEKYWFSTGVRAIDHCVEGLSSTNDIHKQVEDAESIRDALADALYNLLENLLFLKTRDYHDLNARLQCQLAAMLSPRSAVIGVGASHGIGHQLGPLGVGHGETSCILLPNVLKFNWKHGDELTRQRQERVRNIFWSAPGPRELFEKKGLEEDSAGAGELLDVYVRELGMPRTLTGMGIRRDQFEALAESSLKDPCTNNGPVKVGREEVIEILGMAWDD